MDDGAQVTCQRCDHDLVSRRDNWRGSVAALTVAGCILFMISNLYPFIGLEIAGISQSSRLLSGVMALWQREQWLLGLLVFGTIFLFPLLELVGLGVLVLFYRSGSDRARKGTSRIVRPILRWLKLSGPWNMLEIFLIGVLVTSFKLGNMAALVPGVGIYAFAVLVVILILANQQLQISSLWQWLEPNNHFVSSDRPGERLFPCHVCQALLGNSLLERGVNCPRCGYAVHRRQPRSLERTLALLVASAILYIPANTMPIMVTTTLGVTESSTILSGVQHLAHSGSWLLAAVVFVASILVPVTKMLILALLLWSVYRGWSGDRRQRLLFYRVTEFIGRWSMIDVYVITLLVVLVQFGLLTAIEPGVATLAFASVVVLTMLAAESFDPRLIWDGASEDAEEEVVRADKSGENSGDRPLPTGAAL